MGEMLIVVSMRMSHAEDDRSTIKCTPSPSHRAVAAGPSVHVMETIVTDPTASTSTATIWHPSESTLLYCFSSPAPRSTKPRSGRRTMSISQHWRAPCSSQLSPSIERSLLLRKVKTEPAPQRIVEA